MDLTFLIKAGQLILSLSILVFAHELGHFGFAKLFKVRVDKFYLFFHPVFTLLKAKKINGKWQFKFFAPSQPDHLQELKDEDGNTKHDKKGRPIMVPAPLEELDDNDWRKHPESTECGIGWLPLGGYCKIAGMVDESMDSAVVNSEPQPWEYRAQKAWKRLLIIIGGVLVNFILALLVYGAVLFTWGEDYLPLQNAKYGMNYSQLALDNGFQNGDLVYTIGGEVIDAEKEVVQKILIDGKRDVVVKRGEALVDITLPNNFSELMIESGQKQFMELRYPFIIENVMSDSPAEKAGLQSGDKIVALNDKQLDVYQDIVAELANIKDMKVTIAVLRGDSIVADSIHIDLEGKLGVMLANPINEFETVHKNYTFLQAIPAGITMGVETLSSYVKSIKLVFTKAGAKSIGGFGTIGSLFPHQWNWKVFWSMTAFLSIILAFMNILPIPVLDGGFVLFILYEMITGKKPSDKFMEWSLTIGMVLLFGLLIYANANDVLKLF